MQTGLPQMICSQQTPNIILISFEYQERQDAQEKRIENQNDNKIVICTIFMTRSFEDKGSSFLLFHVHHTKKKKRHLVERKKNEQKKSVREKSTLPIVSVKKKPMRCQCHLGDMCYRTTVNKFC